MDAYDAVPCASRIACLVSAAAAFSVVCGLPSSPAEPPTYRPTAKAVHEGIEAMEREEPANWLGMAFQRKHPRRVLAALRILLTKPRG